MQEYDVIMRALARDKQIHAIKALGALTGRGLAECKAIVDAVVAGEPRVVLSGLSYAAAGEAATRLREVCDAEISAAPAR